MAKAKVRSAMDGVENEWRTDESSSDLDALTRGLEAGCGGWDFVARRKWTKYISAAEAVGERKCV
jgi:hypothetical protein